MSSVEIVPILSGLLLGAFLGWIEPASRKRIGVPIALALALFATITSGEFRVSWAFLLLDALLVTAAALVGLVTLHRVRWSPSAQKRL